MSKKRTLAYRIWQQRFGDLEFAEDFSGRMMERSEYGNPESPFGWNLDHVCPKSRGGINRPNNLIPTNCHTNQEKGSRTSFWTKGRHYEVRRAAKADWLYYVCPFQQRPD